MDQTTHDETRQQLTDALGILRPRLHRFCARTRAAGQVIVESGDARGPRNAAEAEHRNPLHISAQPEPRNEQRIDGGRRYACHRCEEHEVDFVGTDLRLLERRPDSVLGDLFRLARTPQKHRTDDHFVRFVRGAS